MTQKEKLIELLSNCPTDPEGNRNVAVVAQHLFDNGVVVVDYEAVSHENRQLIHFIAGAPINEFLDFVRAKREDRIIVPPCKVGDTVYALGRVDGLQIKECKVEHIDIDSNSKAVFVYFECDQYCEGCYFNSWKQDYSGEWSCDGEYGNGVIEFDDFGKTVFLTKDEAENKIKELAKNDC